MGFITLHIDGKEILVNTQEITMIRAKKITSQIYLGMHVIEVQESLKKIRAYIDNDELAEVLNTSRVAIRQNSYITINRKNFLLPHEDVLKKIQGKDQIVDAYYVLKDGEITDVTLYQNKRFICECIPQKRYTRNGCS